MSAPSRARRWLALALSVALTVGYAQSDPCAALEAPFDDAVRSFAAAVIEGMHAENRPNAVRAYVHLPGWPTATRGTWSFQYPPTWTLRDSGMMHGWVSDARDASHLLFVIQTTTPGNPTVEELFAGLLGATIGPHAACDRVAFVASDVAQRWYLAGRTDDVGRVHAWVFRWIDARHGPMMASLKLDLQASGLVTAYGYVLTSTPEAELAEAVRGAFGPMAATFQGSLGGTERDDAPKKRGDGEEDEDDE